jgi:Ca2+-binding RTX toxin-like protein
VTAADPDAGATLTYSITGGADAVRFSINASTGVLTFVSAPDFEIPVDAGGDNVYDVRVQVSDGILTDMQDIAVTVSNVGGVQIGDGNDNTLIGTGEEDTISGLGGNDIIDGGLGDDVLNGDDGDDTLSGGAGFDTFDGGKGNDTIFSGTGDTSIDGGEGNDRIYIDASAIASGNSYVFGNAGTDTVIFTGTGTITKDNLYNYSSFNEIFDFTNPGIIGDMTNFTDDYLLIAGIFLANPLLTFDFDGNDTFSVAAGEHYTQVGNLYTFYTDAGLTTEIGRVSII